MPSTIRLRHFIASLMLSATATAAAAEPESFEEALVQALDDPSAPLAMTVNCTDEQGIRSMQSYPGGVVFWSREWQARLGDADRTFILQTLLQAGFADFGAHYGGKTKPEKAEAALRVMCRVAVEVGGQQKSSVQEVYGERSQALLTLAGSLLDRVQMLEKEGIRAESLGDGLAKIGSGTLAPEALILSYSYLPTGDAQATGMIVELKGGLITRKAYRPGSGRGEPLTSELAGNALEKLLDALGAARIDELPLNLVAEDIHQLEVQVLAHRHATVARPFKAVDSAPQEANRFLQLTEVLRELPVEAGR